MRPFPSKIYWESGNYFVTISVNNLKLRWHFYILCGNSYVFWCGFKYFCLYNLKLSVFLNFGLSHNRKTEKNILFSKYPHEKYFIEEVYNFYVFSVFLFFVWEGGRWSPSRIVFFVFLCFLFGRGGDGRRHA